MTRRPLAALLGAVRRPRSAEATLNRNAEVAGALAHVGPHAVALVVTGPNDLGGVDAGWHIHGPPGPTDDRVVLAQFLVSQARSFLREALREAAFAPAQAEDVRAAGAALAAADERLQGAWADGGGGVGGGGGGGPPRGGEGPKRA